MAGAFSAMNMKIGNLTLGDGWMIHEDTDGRLSFGRFGTTQLAIEAGYPDLSGFLRLGAPTEVMMSASVEKTTIAALGLDLSKFSLEASRYGLKVLFSDTPVRMALICNNRVHASSKNGEPLMMARAKL